MKTTSSAPSLLPGYIFPDNSPHPVSDYINLLEVPRQNQRPRNVTQSTYGQNVIIGQLEYEIEKSKKRTEKIEVDTSLSTCFNGAEEILDRKYLEKIDDEKDEFKEIEEEHNFVHIFEQTNEGVIPK